MNRMAELLWPFRRVNGPELPMPVETDRTDVDPSGYRTPTGNGAVLTAIASDLLDADLPRFQNLPRAGTGPQGHHIPSQLSHARTKLRDAFTSTQPVQRREQLVGRRHELEHLIAAVGEQRAHVLIYGRRGYGKTSLVRTFGEIADEAHYFVVYASCSHTMAFSDLFRPYLEALPVEFSTRRKEAEDAGKKMLSELVPGDYTAHQLAELLRTIDTSRVIIILDEYDRVVDPAVQRAVAELIKDLSDLQASAHLVLVGVAQNVQQLLGFHPSVHRNVVCVPLERFGNEASLRLIESGARASGLTLEEDVVDGIVSLAFGSPYHLRLICLHAGLAALGENHTVIDWALLCQGLRDALAEWGPLDPPAAELAARLRKDAHLRSMMEAISIACLKHRDRFTVSQAVEEYMRDVIDADRQSAALKMGSLCKTLASKNEILRLCGEQAKSAAVYEFANHLTPQFLLMAARLASD